MADSHAALAAEFRDKRYSGQQLLIDLRDAEFETAEWTLGHFLITADPKKLPAGIEKGDLVTGVFNFEGVKDNGLFEAQVEAFDREHGVLAGRYEWMSERGRALLGRMAVGVKRPLRIALTYRTLNWSFSGMLLGNYHGDLKDGEHFRAMIWSDTPKDPGLFNGHVVQVNKDRYTLAIKFDELADETFALLEQAIKKRDGGFKSPAPPAPKPAKR